MYYEQKSKFKWMIASHASKVIAKEGFITLHVNKWLVPVFLAMT